MDQFFLRFASSPEFLLHPPTHTLCARAVHEMTWRGRTDSPSNRPRHVACAQTKQNRHDATSSNKRLYNASAPAAPRPVRPRRTTRRRRTLQGRGRPGRRRVTQRAASGRTPALASNSASDRGPSTFSSNSKTRPRAAATGRRGWSSASVRRPLRDQRWKITCSGGAKKSQPATYNRAACSSSSPKNRCGSGSYLTRRHT